ncbi:hypothetical protein JMJ56_26975 [Belnapia sp. T18]|uniref:Uncharacterized protein n=1 Tax=Belnapia arida TaxID=2804533 RepID=A0ABS1UBX8_9PROT|nr:hypothetical protein [Belnapia arida]MBL6081640.1 hypothetical protein [Belnapia arida]
MPSISEKRWSMGIQRDSVRAVLACDAIMVEFLPAHAREVTKCGDQLVKLIRDAPKEMSAAQQAAWNVNFLSSVTDPLGRLDSVHKAAADAGIKGNPRRCVSHGSGEGSGSRPAGTGSDLRGADAGTACRQRREPRARLAPGCRRACPALAAVRHSMGTDHNHSGKPKPGVQRRPTS